jgi:chaperonin GroES
MNIKPIGNRAVVKLLKTQTTKSGFIIALDSKNEQQKGEIIAIGQGFESEEGNINKLGVCVGDVVLLSKYGGEIINDENDKEIEYKIVTSKDIIAIITN